MAIIITIIIVCQATLKNVLHRVHYEGDTQWQMRSLEVLLTYGLSGPPSVGRLGWLVGWFVRQSVGQLVGHSVCRSVSRS